MELEGDLKKTIRGLQMTVESSLMRAEVCLESLHALVDEKDNQFSVSKSNLSSIAESFVTRESNSRVSL